MKNLASWIILVVNISTILLCLFSGYINFVDGDYVTSLIMLILAFINVAVVSAIVSLIKPKRKKLPLIE